MLQFSKECERGTEKERFQFTFRKGNLETKKTTDRIVFLCFEKQLEVTLVKIDPEWLFFKQLECRGWSLEPTFKRAICFSFSKRYFAIFHVKHLTGQLSLRFNSAKSLQDHIPSSKELHKLVIPVSVV